MRAAAVLSVIALLAACAPTAEAPASPSATPTASPAPSSTPTTAPSPTAPPSPKVETAAVILDLVTGPSYDQPAATTPGVGGLSSRGPTSIAVDEAGRVYVWDDARVRILVYENGKLSKVFPEPFVAWGSGALLEQAGRLYLRWYMDSPVAEYVIDAATGELLEVGTGLYPRERAPFRMSEKTGPEPPMSPDALGNRYDRVVAQVASGSVFRVRRRDAALNVVATADVPTNVQAVDSYVAADGAVYDLRYVSYEGGIVRRVAVARVLSPAGTVPAAPAYVAASPRFAGRETPSSIEVVSAPQLPPARLTGIDARSLWWLLALSRADPARNGSPPGVADAYRLTAIWNDGSTADIVIGSNGLYIGTDFYLNVPLGRVDYVLPEVLLRSSFLSDALRRYGARIAIPDVPGVGRALTGSEIAQLADALESSFPTTPYERWRPLEDAFPRRQVTIDYGAGKVVLQDSGDRYLRTDLYLIGSLVHDGRASNLLRMWLPAPSLSRNDPSYLFLATKVTLPSQDISRWKASIVRELVVLPSRSGQGTWDAMGPLTYTFSFADGSTETVRVDATGFTYRGKTYERTGLLDLHGYEGVP